MNDCGIASNHQVKILKNSRRIHERLEPTTQVSYREPTGILCELFAARALLQTEEANAFQSCQRLKVRQWNGTLFVFLVDRVSLPDDADFQNPSASEGFFPSLALGF